MSSQVEVWYWIDYRNRRLMEHTENDGYACLRHGICAEDRPVRVADLSDHEVRRALKNILHGAHPKGPTGGNRA